MSPDTPPAAPAWPLALARWQRRCIYASVALLVATGVGWLAVAWPFGAADEPSAAARRAAVWALRLHGIAAYAALLAIGSALTVHVRTAWVRRRNRWSGGVLLGGAALLAGSGLWLYYGSETARSVVSTVHWGIGLVFGAWLLLHRSLGLRTRAAGARRSG